MTPIKRAARALCEADGHDPDGASTSSCGDPYWMFYQAKVMTVLAAIREPSEIMAADQKWIVCWINHQFEHTWDVFDTQTEARTFIEKEQPNVQFLYRGELVEAFNGGDGVKLSAPPLPDRTFAFRASSGGPLQFVLAPGESVEPGDLVTFDSATGKVRKFVNGVDAGRAFTVPPGSRMNDDGYLEMPQ